ncbi:1,3,6,8-tetrahydroxynaphthalene synthase [Streptomyces durmitorensis]|uniref:PhlD n=1 Tax=Streptomyces durmitorensis TaxID=319947 RepID=A0ABY4PL14_9ACTN|nr:3-oxoacyl-[acyl-carrier-protein] synthase III C-terminal domain-containing protein [Streptomyces durmitorensis]UQT54296.1 PhlD [Streptomyces durmitorensis]
MPAFVSSPRTVFGSHKVTTDEIVDDIRSHHNEHPRLTAVLRVVGNCGVRTRHFSRPLASPTVSGTAGVHERTQAAFDDAVAMSEQAATAALDAAGLTAQDIDAIVTTHSTGWAVPNLDVHLIARLGLRPTVRRVALTTVACAGGVQSLIRASDLVAARPDSKVLVVAAEVLSTSYNHCATTMESMIYKALFADAAGAVVVTGAPLTSGLAIEDSFEHTLPDSLDRYRGRLDASGMHFDSTKQAPSTAAAVLPSLMDWLGPQPVDFAVIHPGSHRIISDTAQALGLDADKTRHSVDTLTDEGNMGAASIFRVLERTHAAPPADGSHGTAVAFGPGFVTAGLRCHWQA